MWCPRAARFRVEILVGSGRRASCSVVRETPNLANGKQQVASPLFTRPLLGNEACKKRAWWTVWVKSLQRVTFVIINSHRTTLSPKHAQQIRRRRTSRGRQGYFSGGWVRAPQGPKRNVTRKAMRWKKSSRPRSIHPWLWNHMETDKTRFAKPHTARTKRFMNTVAHCAPTESGRQRQSVAHVSLPISNCSTLVQQLCTSCRFVISRKPLGSVADTNAGRTLKWLFKIDGVRGARTNCGSCRTPARHQSSSCAILDTFDTLDIQRHPWSFVVSSRIV